MKRRDFVSTIGAGLVGSFLPPPPPPPLLPPPMRLRFVERWSWVMGQAVHVMVYADSDDLGLEACAKALAELRRLEGVFSLFDDASELCELNRCAGKRTLKASPDLWQAVYQADVFRQFTAGAFNPAVEPLMRVWGFHRSRHHAWPSPAELADAREAVATATVNLSGGLSLPNSHTRLDLGGMAVGFAIDEAKRAFFNPGIHSAFIDVSGDCYGLGAPPGEPDGWPVRIAGSTRVVRLRNSALATSSNTKSVIEIETRILGHVMDPVRGCPVDTSRQVTQLAPAAVLADYLSTAALVTGRGYDHLWPTYFTE
jgi:FAD:protein FMN transferase